MLISQTLVKDSLYKKTEHRDSLYWDKLNKKNAMDLFHSASIRVPAYRKFLKKNKINPKNITTWNDFQKVPIVTKKNYLVQFPLNELCWDGELKKPFILSSSSGSTGDPFFWLRNSKLDYQYSFILEDFFKKNDSFNGPTLVMVCFGLGVWISGFITYSALEILNNIKGCNLTIATPGISKKEIINLLTKVSPKYKNTVLIGYAPFLKNLFDEIREKKVLNKKVNYKLIFAAEKLPEKMRDYFFELLGMKNIYLDTLNIYGSADMGAMAVENDVSIFIKRFLVSNNALREKFFKNVFKVPTIAQFDPSYISFETINDQIVLSSDSGGFPLVRYAIGDQGGIISFSSIQSEFAAQKIKIIDEFNKIGINQFFKKPFVYIFERSDFSTKLYGAIIYPEPIKNALLDERLYEYFSGKFTLETKYSNKHIQYLEIAIELKQNVKIDKAIKDLTLKIILEYLLKNNAEFSNNYNSNARKENTPKLIFITHDNEKYFNDKGKHVWVKK